MKRGDFGPGAVKLITKFKTIIALGMLLCILHSAVLSQTGAEDLQTGVNDPARIRTYQQLITAESLAARLYFLASDFFEGRETGTRGQRLAAHYLASQYRQLGLTPKGTQSSADSVAPEAYFQSFSVFRRTPKQSRLEVSIDSKVVASSTFSADSHDDLSFFLSGGFSDASGEVVFAG